MKAPFLCIFCSCCILPQASSCQNALKEDGYKDSFHVVFREDQKLFEEELLWVKNQDLSP